MTTVIFSALREIVRVSSPFVNFFFEFPFIAVGCVSGDVFRKEHDSRQHFDILIYGFLKFFLFFFIWYC